jgi:hypothetical protein
MKKILLFFALLIIMLNSQAQTTRDSLVYTPISVTTKVCHD